MNYREAKDLLDGKGKRRGPRDSLKIARNTYLERGEAFRPWNRKMARSHVNWHGEYGAAGNEYPDNAIGLRFHGTYVAILTPHWTELYTGGWHTKSTADRIRYVASIGADRGGWTVFLGGCGWNDNGHPFYDGIRISADRKRLMREQPHKTRGFTPVRTESGW